MGVDDGRGLGGEQVDGRDAGRMLALLTGGLGGQGDALALRCRAYTPRKELFGCACSRRGLRELGYGAHGMGAL